ncbi:Hypothetical predicted protein, partial [Paramuricea clavata]
MGTVLSPKFTPASTPATISEILMTTLRLSSTELIWTIEHLSSSLLISPTPDHAFSHDIFLTTEQVLNTLLALDPDKATLKETAQQIAPSPTKLFNRSLSCGVFPDDWKRANIVPLHKKGIKRYVENYRPISLLSLISNALEWCVLRNARDYLLDLINCFQHGFIPGKSCTTQLLVVHNYIGSLLDA